MSNDTSSNNSSTVGSSEEGCSSYNDITVAVLFYSIAVLALYALLQRRVNKYKEICHGFLGIPIPVNLIHETKDRWIYALAFGSLTGQFLYLILDGSVLSSAGPVGNIWRGILLILIMMIYPLSNFALFASIHGAIQVVSQIIGFVYVLLLFIQLILRCSDCDNAIDGTISPGIVRNTNRALLYSQCMPTGILFVLLGAFFVWRGVQVVVYLIMRKPLPPQHTVNHHIGHVKRLLNSLPPSVPSNRLFAIIQTYLYQWDPYFKFSVRIISTGAVIILALFLLTFALVNNLVLLTIFLEEYVYNSLDLDEDFVDAIVGLSYFFGILVPFISYVMAIIGYLTSLATYKRQCKLLWKGDRSFLPAKKRPTARILLSSIHFFGFQVAMVVWAWILYSILLTVIMFAILIFIISMVLFDFVREWVLERFVLFVTSFVMGYIVYYAQYFFIKYAFVCEDEGQKKPFWGKSSKSVEDQTCSTPREDKVHTATKGNIVLVDNRRLFHLFTFFFIFYYMLIGLFKAIRRVIVSAALNIFYFSRLDTPLTVKGWEFLDKAYVSYAAILKVDATYNNPVMNVFVYLVSHVAEAKSAREESSSFPLSVIEKITVTKYYNRSLSAPLLIEQNNDVITSRAKKRWHLAYTLVRNPDLIQLRRRSRDNQDEDDNKDSTPNNGHCNPVYVNEGGEFSVPIEKHDATKL